MVLRQPIATAAALAIDQNLAVQDISYEMLRATRVENEQRLVSVKD